MVAENNGRTAYRIDVRQTTPHQRTLFTGDNELVSTSSLFVDASTFLLVKQRFRPVFSYGAGLKHDHEAIFSDFRTVDGIAVPGRVVRQSPAGQD